MQADSDKPPQTPVPAHRSAVVGQPDYSRPLKPVGELLEDPGFPKSALGEFVDIGGYTGVVVELVNQSLKVRSPEGATKSFNVNGLRRIYGPVTRPDPMPEPIAAPEPAPVQPRPRAVATGSATPRATATAPAPKLEPAIEPDFKKPVVNIAAFMKRPDYPRCLLAEHVEIGGYRGVVVQIVGRSLKVRSEAEITRSYNADALRKLYP